MNVFIEYVSVITAWQNYTYTQQMHNNTWNHNTSQRDPKTQIRFILSLSSQKKSFLLNGRPHPLVGGGDIVQ